MSDLQSKEEERGGSAATPSPAKGTNPVRLVLLLLLFGLALAGLLYDYTIARPSIQKADRTIQGLLDGSIEDPNNDDTVTPDEVQLMLGAQPSRVEPLSNGTIEVYSWRSGLPYRTYDLYVVYSGKQLPLLHSATVNTKPEGDQLPAVTIVPPRMSEEQIKNFVPPQAEVVGPGMGQAAKKKSRGEKRSPDGDTAKEQPPAEPAKEQPPTTEPRPPNRRPPNRRPPSRPRSSHPPPNRPPPNRPPPNRRPLSRPRSSHPPPNRRPPVIRQLRKSPRKKRTARGKRRLAGA